MPAPAIAIHYWKLPQGATLRVVVLVVQSDEAHNRDINHGFANTIAGLNSDTSTTAPYPAHADEIRMKA